MTAADDPGIIDETELVPLDIFVTAGQGEVVVTMQTTGTHGELEDYSLTLTPVQARQLGESLFTQSYAVDG